jgi:hypothetical protein
MTPQERRRLKALAPSAYDAIPQGGVDRAKRIFDSTPSDLPELVRLMHTKAVLRMLAEAT